jgi:hypothetical protein
MTVVSVLSFSQALMADSGDAARRKAEMNKAEHRRRIAEMKRSASAPHRGLPPVSKPAAPTRDFRGNPVGGQSAASAPQQPPTDFRGNRVTSGSSKPPEVPFNAASAPKPEEAFMAFVKVARTAGTMDQLLPYLPESRQQELKQRQANYDPKRAAESRLRWRQKKPEMKEESIAFLTNPPYTNELNRLKGIAGGVIEVLRVNVDGNKATLVVSTTSGATINGERYEYGAADVELVGEENGWKVASYDDSAWVYKERPQPVLKGE